MSLPSDLCSFWTSKDGLSSIDFSKVAVTQYLADTRSIHNRDLHPEPVPAFYADTLRLTGDDAVKAFTHFKKLHGL